MRKIFFLTIICFSYFNSNAQVDRRIGAGQYTNTNKGEKTDIIESTIETLKKELNLDGFQEAIVRNLIKENQSKSKEIFESKDYNDIEKKNLLTELGDKFNIELKKILSDDQNKKYEKLFLKKKK